MARRWSWAVRLALVVALPIATWGVPAECAAKSVKLDKAVETAAKKAHKTGVGVTRAIIRVRGDQLDDAEHLLKAFGYKLHRKSELVSGLSLDIPDVLIDTFAAQSWIQSISLDAAVTAGPIDDDVENLDGRVLPAIGEPRLPSKLEQIGVAVIDSGIEPN